MTRAIFGIGLVLAMALAAPAETLGSRSQPAAGVHHASLHAPAAFTPPENHCPYDFKSPMPWGVFCLYRGTLRGPAGNTCSGDVGMIWSSYDPANDSIVSTGGTPVGSVTLGLMSDPEIVFRATSGPGQVEAAELIAFSTGEDSWQAVVGHARLTLEQQPATEPLQVLSLQIKGLVLPLFQGCPLVSYEGTFVGVLGPPAD